MTQVHPQVPCCTSCRVVQDPLPEEVKFHPAIATALDQLEAIDLALNGAGRPGKSSCGVHGSIVPLEPFGAVLHLHTGAGATGLEPRIQLGRLPLADHGCPLANQRRHFPQLGMLLEACPERLLVCCALRCGLQQEPGELACRGQPRRGWWRRPSLALAMGVRPLCHQRTGARKALRADFAPQAGLIRTACCEARAEVGDRGIDFPGPPIESREMLGIMDQLRYNGLDHSPAT